MTRTTIWTRRLAFVSKMGPPETWPGYLAAQRRPNRYVDELSFRACCASCARVRSRIVLCQSLVLILVRSQLAQNRIKIGILVFYEIQIK